MAKKKQKKKKKMPEQAPRPKDFLDMIAPAAIKFNTDHFILGSRYHTAMTLKSYALIRDPQRGSCLYKCGNERYLLQVQAPEYKQALFGTAGGR